MLIVPFLHKFRCFCFTTFGRSVWMMPVLMPNTDFSLNATYMAETTFISAVCTGGLCCLIIVLVSVLGTFLFLQLLLLCLEVDTLFFFWTWALLYFCHLESGFLQRTVLKTMPRDQKGASPREHRTPTG